jgi:hypothetical protein
MVLLLLLLRHALKLDQLPRSRSLFASCAAPFVGGIFSLSRDAHYSSSSDSSFYALLKTGGSGEGCSSCGCSVRRLQRRL